MRRVRAGHLQHDRCRDFRREIREVIVLLLVVRIQEAQGF
jgi:hypothetical protein